MSIRNLIDRITEDHQEEVERNEREQKLKDQFHLAHAQFQKFMEAQEPELTRLKRAFPKLAITLPTGQSATLHIGGGNRKFGEPPAGTLRLQRRVDRLQINTSVATRMNHVLKERIFEDAIINDLGLSTTGDELDKVFEEALHTFLAKLFGMEEDQ